MEKQNNSDWYGQTIETPSTPMIDSGTGKPHVLRQFRFAMKPLRPGTPHPSKQELFNVHWEYIRTSIKYDGLVANTDIEPRVTVGKRDYRIFIVCEPKFREVVIDKPQTLQQVFDKKKK